MNFLDFIVKYTGKKLVDEKGRTLSKATAYWATINNPGFKFKASDKPGWHAGTMINNDEYETWIKSVKMV